MEFVERRALVVEGVERVPDPSGADDLQCGAREVVEHVDDLARWPIREGRGQLRLQLRKEGWVSQLDEKMAWMDVGTSRVTW